MVRLTDGTRKAEAFSIFVEGNDVYVGGYKDVDGMGNDLLTYWKNGSPTTLTDVRPMESAGSLYVRSGNVYIAGAWNAEDNDWLASYWKNGQRQIIGQSPAEGSTSGVRVAGGNVFACGSYGLGGGYEMACYWKNGELFRLKNGPTESWTYSIAVSGNDVYVVGSKHNAEGECLVMCWKNGTAMPMTSAGASGTLFGEAHSVFLAPAPVQ